MMALLQKSSRPWKECVVTENLIRLRFFLEYLGQRIKLVEERVW